MNWTEVYNKLFEIINSGDNYFSGPRYLDLVREFRPDFPDYYSYIDQLRAEYKNTSRKDYFREVFLSFDELRRAEFTRRILRETEGSAPHKSHELLSMLGGEAAAPRAAVPDHIWNADRLNRTLEDIDSCITAGRHERAITLSYTCLEGFFRAFIDNRIPDKKEVRELVSMSREIQRYLKSNIPAYPDEALKLINHIAHTVDRTRNGFSESHFGNEAEKWLSTFVRDCVNSSIRLLLSFM
jgi:hypothetical protein